MFTICTILSIVGLVVASLKNEDHWLYLGLLSSLALFGYAFRANNLDLAVSSALWIVTWGWLLMAEPVPGRKTQNSVRLPSIYSKTGDSPLLFLAIAKIQTNGACTYEGRILGTRTTRRGMDLGEVRKLLVEDAITMAQTMTTQYKAAVDAGDPEAYTHLVPAYTVEDLYRIHTVVPTITIRREPCAIAEFLEI